MKTLITGGAGFIGSHLAERLIREGCEVAIVDELNDFYSPKLKCANLEAVKGAARGRLAPFFQADICDEAAMADVFDRVEPEMVIHLAARAGVRPSLEQPLLYERVNVHGTAVLLEECRKKGIKHFIFASSSSVYGAASRAPFREDDPVCRPISPYAATKLAGEAICHTYSHLYGMRVVCLRFFTVYGPRQRPDLAIRKFTDLIERGEPVPVFGDGSSSRDYTFIQDIVNGVVAATRYNCAYEIFNLGNSHPENLLDLIRALEEAIGKRAEIRWLPDQPGDVPITYADIGKAARLLSYSPQTPFRQGICEFVEWRRAVNGLA
ncbi:MAG TPA: NAD-dependent epimerase/dehydratase family protein [Bryobacteraceae bacterium]|jgi:UDP-glucuronate 4-epimerase